jgi:hypothetical protein
MRPDKLEQRVDRKGLLEAAANTAQGAIARGEILGVRGDHDDRGRRRRCGCQLSLKVESTEPGQLHIQHEATGLREMTVAKVVLDRRKSFGGNSMESKGASE